jgi:hypothetical protein
MNWILILLKKSLTGSTGFSGFFFLPHFPEENEETKSPSAKKDNFKSFK